jgi:hypothetical protein
MALRWHPRGTRLPQLPDSIQPLGPPLPRTLRAPTWPQFVAAFCPPVRELRAGERPRDWTNDGFESVDGSESPRAGGEAAGVGDETLQEEGDALPVGPVPTGLPPVTGPQQYQVQFSTDEEHVQLIERAKALLAREKPGATLGELHCEAMKMFVAALEQRKFAVTGRPRKSNKPATPDAHHRSEAPRQRVSSDAHHRSEAPRQRVSSDAHHRSEAPRQRVAFEQRHPTEVLRQHVAAVVDRHEVSETPRRRGRYIPAAERREAYQRDCGRCSYVDERGERCCETRYLEIHHLQPFARQGANSASNLALRCRAHNALAAEQDFGPELTAKKRDSLGHESLRAQVDANTKR